MKLKNSTIVIVAATCCFIACIGDFAITFIIGSIYKNYNFLNQSESFLGTSDSPVAMYMNVWGVFFSMLFVMYAYGLRKSIFKSGPQQLVAVWLIVIYGLGEGVGSGLFPYDHIGDELTLSGKLHSLFSGIGVAALMLFPFVILKLFSKKSYPKMNAYSLFVGLSGLFFVILFLLAREEILPLKGLWQRLFILDYYLLLMTIAITMVTTHSRITNPQNTSHNQ